MSAFTRVYRGLLGVIAVATALAFATPAAADTVILRNGRTIKAEAARATATGAWELVLPGGASMTIRANDVERIDRDERPLSEWHFQNRVARYRSFKSLQPTPAKE